MEHAYAVQHGTSVVPEDEKARYGREEGRYGNRRLSRTEYFSKN